MAETIAPPVTVEGRRVMIITCSNCNFYSSLPTTTLRLVEDSKLMQETAKQHQDLYRHKIEFTVK